MYTCFFNLCTVFTIMCWHAAEHPDSLIQQKQRWSVNLINVDKITRYNSSSWGRVSPEGNPAFSSWGQIHKYKYSYASINYQDYYYYFFQSKARALLWKRMHPVGTWLPLWWLNNVIRDLKDFLELVLFCPLNEFLQFFPLSDCFNTFWLDDSSSFNIDSLLRIRSTGRYYCTAHARKVLCS